MLSFTAPPQYDKDTGISTCSGSSSTSLPGDHIHDILLEEAERARESKAEKEEALRQRYSTFEDEEPSFPNDNRILPDTITDIDKVAIRCQMLELLERENTALQSARIYRDECTRLKQRCRELETEKEGIRYFWRNKVFEGQSRGGYLLRLACQKSMKD